ncbi:hypothetical protein PENARI_c080G01840 [Penicillium arizonense]|uniref:Uncharacterized protein n=1 Tax=Penicillium arizonense TaxID=1835702 RepID=A0A1F5L186_PENAI|nr:hypothetical protein PENARI_c080G01840 [Penicillium arizonense]OGE46983.1 hypothetical protein PENARI_c080G01840 [Penicillium arizonense]
MAASISEQDTTNGEASPGSPEQAKSIINDVHISADRCLSSEVGEAFQACLTPSEPQTQNLQCSQHFSRTSSMEIVELYSVLWDCYTTEKAELHRLQQEVKILRSANAQLCLRLQIAEQESYNQRAFLAYFEQRFANLQKNLKNFLQYKENDESEVNAEAICH